MQLFAFIVLYLPSRVLSARAKKTTHPLKKKSASKKKKDVNNKTNMNKNEKGNFGKKSRINKTKKRYLSFAHTNIRSLAKK